MAVLNSRISRNFQTPARVPNTFAALPYNCLNHYDADPDHHKQYFVCLVNDLVSNEVKSWTGPKTDI